VSDDVAAIDAEGIEHHVSRQTLECFRKMTEELVLKSPAGNQGSPGP
jgi:hypothetical protein